MSSGTSMTVESVILRAANEARGLAMDAVAACKSGHLGLPLGAAEIGGVLFGQCLKFNAKKPGWLNRDRFILSAGHGSMFLYGWLHLSGYDVSLEDLKGFRKMHSRTPGHPEYGETEGVECTTGPLGQGVGNAVGMAMAAKMAGAQFNTAEQKIIDHAVVCLCGDGCLQEGVAAEAMSFAGRMGLDNLIYIYDSNDVTLDAPAGKTQGDDMGMRFKSYGFDVVTIDGHDVKAIYEAYQWARGNRNGRPKMIIAKTKIGKGIVEVEGTPKAHGEAGVKFIGAARAGLGLPEGSFYVSEEVREYFRERQREREKEYGEWEKLYQAWQGANPDKAKLLEASLERKWMENLMDLVPAQVETPTATRNAGGVILNALAGHLPTLVSGSADLHGSTKNYIKDGKDFDEKTLGGRNIYFGIREHAMGAIVNGFGYYGIFIVSGATFLTFSDYMRPSLRLAALAKLPVFQIFTHDSIGVGEDGPTHQPIETVSSLRLIPNLDVIRPGDAEETVGAFVAAIERKDGPSVLCLSRQDLPVLKEISVKERREGVRKGAYIARKETEGLKMILMATGSELHLAMEAAKALGGGVRVVSCPCLERFERQSGGYQEEVMPKSCRKRVAIEAGVSDVWYRYVGCEGKVVGIDRFGMSAPGEQVMKELGMSVENLVKVAKELL